jgi:hypothetical protein
MESKLHADTIAEWSRDLSDVVRRLPEGRWGDSSFIVVGPWDDGGSRNHRNQITSGVGEKNFTTKTRRSRRGENSEFVRLKRGGCSLVEVPSIEIKIASS